MMKETFTPPRAIQRNPLLALLLAPLAGLLLVVGLPILGYLAALAALGEWLWRACRRCVERRA